MKFNHPHTPSTFAGVLFLMMVLCTLFPTSALAAGTQQKTAGTTVSAAQTTSTDETQNSADVTAFDLGDETSKLSVFGEDEAQNDDAQAQAAAQAEQEAQAQAANAPRSLGVFRLTAYCPCYKCSEGFGARTATGRTAQAGRTIAVDPRVIPYGSRVLINGHEYIAEDCGGAIKSNRIDIFFSNHSQARAFGVQYAEIFLLP